MKAETKFFKLKSAVSITERAAGKHATLPVLSCVLIEFKKDALVLKSTNLDVGIEMEIPAKTTGTGSVAVPARTLSSFLSQSGDKDQPIVIEFVNNNLVVSLSKSKGTIKSVPHDDFPVIPEVSNGETRNIKSKALIEGFKAVWYSASVSSVKPELASIYVYKDGDFVVFVATDSFRLAEKRVPVSESQQGSIDLLVPFKNSIEIAKALESMDEVVTMKSSKNLISIESAGIKITSRIIDGVFPDYRQIIPKSPTTEAVVLKQDIVNTLKAATVFSDSFNKIKLTADPVKKILEITTKNSDVGENDAAIDAALSGEPIEISFNSKYITDCFQSIDSDSMSLEFSGKNKAMVIKPVSSNQTFMYLVMPMNR
ncbi:MAG: DNA polymerase III subunit beta [Patescibacteria group bacterium]|nr:DNA polymerase III subunit beta [Patescibacteria group bacterium]